MARRPIRTAVVGGVYCYRLRDGRYGACQVLAEPDADSDVVLVGTLDLLSADRPTAESVASAEVIRPDFAWWTGRPDITTYSRQLPWWLDEVAVIDPVEDRTTSDTSGHWGWNVRSAASRERWQQRGVDVKANDPTVVAVDLGSGPHDVRVDTTHFSIGPSGSYPAEVDASIDWDRLDALPNLTDVTYDGTDPGFASFVCRRPIANAAWSAHGRTEIDLSSSTIDRLNITVDGPLTLAMPAGVEELVITGDSSDLTVDGVHPAWPFTLDIHASRIGPPPRGLEAVHELTVSQVVESDTAGLAEYTDLRELRIHGEPGVLTDPSGLLGHDDLRLLWLFDMYDLDGESWIDAEVCSTLESVIVSGLHRNDAKALKQAFAEVPSVEITKARNDAWIGANLNNPFRDWDQDGPAFGKAAVSAWKKAKTRAAKLGDAPTAAQAIPVLEEFVDALNTIGSRHDIDTMRREEAFAGFLQLAADLGIDTDAAGDVFDRVRDF